MQSVNNYNFNFNDFVNVIYFINRSSGIKESHNCHIFNVYLHIQVIKCSLRFCIIGPYIKNSELLFLKMRCDTRKLS